MVDSAKTPSGHQSAAPAIGAAMFRACLLASTCLALGLTGDQTLKKFESANDWGIQGSFELSRPK